MTDKAFADELANDIGLMEQELIIKRQLLEESREKLQLEIAEHKEVQSNLTQCLNEKNELQVQLNISMEAAQNLESEYAKNREIMVKLQVQTNAYLTERQQLLDRCYDAELESERLRNEITDLKERLKVHEAFQENYKERQTQMEIIVNKIFRQQDILKQEQIRLEKVSKEGLKFATKVSEEAQFQFKFVLEANVSRLKLEEELIRLTTALKEFRNERDRRVIEIKNEKATEYYIEEWRKSQREYKENIKKLLEENKRLTEELNLATSQIEILLQNNNFKNN